MHKQFTLVSFIVFFIPFVLMADWVSLNNKQTSPSAPIVTLLSDDNSSTVIKIEIPGFNLKELQTSGKGYQVADLLSESFISNPGSPAIPYLAEILAIPDQTGISVEVLEKGESFTFSNINLPPARASWIEGDPESSYTEEIRAYSSDNSFPGTYLTVDEPSVFRDFRIARVAIYPIQYSPSKKELEVVSSITIRVNYTSGMATNAKTSPKRPIPPSFGQLYRSSILNYQSVLDNNYGGKEEGHELMLCIMPDEFYTSFQPYAEWKRQSGIDIHITKFTDIGASTSDPDIIKTHVEDAYLNWAVPPTYVLIVGDNGVFPTEMISMDGWSFPYESYFVEIEGNDFFPEMFIGRFTNESDYGMQVMINKFTKYEKTPYITTTDWFKKGICFSNDAYESQVGTKRFAATQMRDYGNFEVDTMMDASPCNYNLSDGINAINSGRSFLNYRGEGWSDGWWNGCSQIGTSDVSQLNNGEKFTFVTSIGCGVGMFNAGGGNCFGEEWVEMGTLSNPKGAVAFIGPGSNTHTTYNNKLDKGIYVGMFPEGLNTPGQGLARGRLYLYNVYGTDPYVEYHFKIYSILGDPSIHIWKDVPQAVTVDYPPSTVFGNNFIEFTVDHTASGLPVENAVVCVSGNDVFVTGITDASGSALLEISADVLETLTVTVTGGNVYPFQGTLEVIPPSGPWVIKDYFLLDDNAGGNGNGLMEFGESILMSLALKNVGTIQTTNVDVVLSSDDPYVTISATPFTYDLILAGQSVLATDAFSFTVANDIPDGHEVLVEITANSLFSSWTSYLTMIGHAPDLSIGGITISDPGGNNNGLLDPGETADITFSISNNGSSISPDATANLSSISSYITLNNISDNIGFVGIGETVVASFNITVSPTTPMGETLDLDLDLIAGDYGTSKSFLTSVGLLIEDWESGDFNKLPWVMGGNAGWSLVTDNPHEGVYCARSGNITHSQVSDLEVTVSVTGNGFITFYRKVSCEDNPNGATWDFLVFYIDDIEQERWDGEVAWGQVSYPVSSGTHTFKWEYSKDNVVSEGEDCAWVDYIVFPSPTVPVTPPYLTEFEEMGSIPEGWHNNAGDDFDWIVNSGSTPSNNTGPAGDHTSGSGYYMYTEATDPNNPNKRADMVTPAFDLSSMTDVEVRFWYHMWDNTVNNYMGTLHLDVLLNDVWIEDVMTPISGNQGDQWFEQVVDLSGYAGETIELRFRGITGAGYASDISIDDFSIDGNLIPSSMEVDITVFLEGPCIGTEMSTFLCACSSIPLSQPFNTAPWNYTGTESVIIMPGNSVDWVLVELRDATSAADATTATTIARQAGLLLFDGTIVATDGISPLSFDNTISNGLYTVVYHRNHLAIMSANSVNQSGGAYTYDFKTALDQAYGTNSQKQLPSGIWGMMSGDVDANGTIGSEDITPAWKTDAGKAGYYPADLNFDQQVDNTDKDDFCIPNLGKGTNVPE